jgi:hypothetical protein
MQRTLACPFFRKAFGWCVPIGGLAGLIGLGGGEFRLSVLMHGIGFDAKSAIPLKLMISLVTLTFAMVSRSGAVLWGRSVHICQKSPAWRLAVWQALSMACVSFVG